MNQNKPGAILCPSCRRLVAIDESRCPHCGTWKPAGFFRHNPLTRILVQPRSLIRSVIVLNTAMFAICLLFSPGALRMNLNPLTLFSPDNDILLLLGATGTIPIDRFHRWWTLLSANYLHGGILHIFFNMAAWSQLAPFMIREYGPYRTVLIYTMGGVAGFAISYGAGVRFTIGASASVCALIGAALYYGKRRGGAYGQAVYRQVGGWALSLFVFGLLVPGINNWGHGGGMAAGVLLGFMLGYQEQLRENGWHVMMGLSAVLITVLVLGWAVATGTYYRFF